MFRLVFSFELLFGAVGRRRGHGRLHLDRVQRGHVGEEVLRRRHGHRRARREDVDEVRLRGEDRHRLRDGFEAHPHPFRVVRLVLASAGKKLLGLHARQVRRRRATLKTI